ncbi:MAG: hypothetical protein RIG68_28740 [Imperialibacter sp.]|uniref:hypothetical protein n=1 Tax=Imperialibacter sp. TaxID=2038411 RepID=UPI0032EB57B8
MKTNTNLYTVITVIIKLLPVILIIAAAASSNAQGVKATSYIEKTKMSPKMGYSVGVVLPGYLGDMELGGFYQKAMNEQGESTYRKIVEEKFYGMYLGVSFIQTERVNVSFKVRAGSVNDKFLLLTPSVFSDVMISRSLGFGFGLGMRNLQPTYTGRLVLKLSNSNQGLSRHSYRRYR